jgi:hypothetical protein
MSRYSQHIFVLKDATPEYINAVHAFIEEWKGKESDVKCEVSSDGMKMWRRGGKLHRDGDLPAVECVNGDRCWYIDGKLSRLGGKPEIVWENGNSVWTEDGVIKCEYETGKSFTVRMMWSAANVFYLD